MKNEKYKNEAFALMNDTGSILNCYINWKKKAIGCVEFMCNLIPFNGNVFIFNSVCFSSWR